MVEAKAKCLWCKIWGSRHLEYINGLGKVVWICRSCVNATQSKINYARRYFD